MGPKAPAPWVAPVTWQLASLLGKVLWQGLEEGDGGRWKTGRQAGGTEPRGHKPRPVPLHHPGLCVHGRSPPSSLSSCSLLLSTWCWHPSSITPRLSSCTSSCSCSVASRSISCLSTSSASPSGCKWPPCISSCSWKLLQPQKMLTKGLDRCALPSLLWTSLSPHKWSCQLFCRLTMQSSNK